MKSKIIIAVGILAVLAGCTKNSDTAVTGNITKEQEKALVDNLGPQPKGKNSLAGDEITMINVKGYFQRGFSFSRWDKSHVKMYSAGLVPEVVMVGTRSLTSLRLPDSLVLDIAKVGIGGLDRDIGRRPTKGIEVYIIAKEDDSAPALIGVPSGSTLSFPKDYSKKSEMLWFFPIIDGDIMHFKDVGNGECLYLNKPISEKDYRFSKSNPSVHTINFDALVPRKASRATFEITFFADPYLPQGSSLTFRTHKNGNEIHTYYPLMGLSERQQQQYQFDAPIEITATQAVEPIDFVFSSALIGSSSSASFVAAVKGWRLYKNY